ncbi:MAG TPA: YqaJ viral recombinase family protein [Pseudobdellovibrionaceae bacterium]|jgi:putative phage-type endonuclease
MKSLKDVESQIKTFQDKFGTDIMRAEQGSMAWLQTRLGVITASEVSAAVAKIGSETRNTYMCQLVAEVATGMVEEINSKYMDWGKLNEDAARSSYEFANDTVIEQVNFIFKDDTFREGASIDGFVSGQKKLVEIKCPYNPTNYIKFIVADKIKAEYQWQYQFQMRVTGAETADFVQYDPRMIVQPIKVLKVERDDEYQKKFDELIPAFLHDMDSMLKLIGIEYGDQWKRIAEMTPKIA